jgi:hypothetical protein
LDHAVVQVVVLPVIALVLVVDIIQCKSVLQKDGVRTILASLLLPALVGLNFMWITGITIPLHS